MGADLGRKGETDKDRERDLKGETERKQG